ncbi:MULTISPECIES: hypothetical protein [Massilia]|jgi:hypothetical protein|uniref:hypothetical protein n=1 Tax=Massilia TaxID=149698 RepID=UPI0004143856|nr:MULTISPECIES: hypothetical protein [Massilia]KFC68265.1 hypothetical protein FG94_02743 [Massilia sp. LC238]MDK6076051.1 hypothetical protein [Massilia varians]
MGITVKNTTPDTAKVTLVGEMMDGSFDAKVMAETDVPYTKYWDNELEQRIVYLHPDPEQLKAIVAALNEGRLSLDALQDFGSSAGGESELPI